MLIFYVLSLYLALEDLSSIKDIVFWSRQQDVPILGIFKEPVDSSKESLFKVIANHFESSECGLSFGLTKISKAWDRYKLPENQTSAIVIHGNYYEEDGEWRSRGSTKFVFNSDWDLSQIVIWITTYSFPPAVDIWHLLKGGADAQRRARFLLGVDMPKILWMHDGLIKPAFFLGIGKHLRERILFLVYDVSESEIPGGLVDKGGWWLTAGVNPLDPSNMWGEYEGELNEKEVNEWVHEVVVSEYLVTYAEQKKRVRNGMNRKKKRNKKKSKKDL